MKKNSENRVLSRSVPPPLLWKKLLTDPSLLLFCTVSLLAILFGEVANGGVALAVFTVWLGCAVLRLWQAWKRRETAERHRSLVVAVLRDGKRKTVAAEALVRGDVILLKKGDLVPADARLLRSGGLRTYLCAEACGIKGGLELGKRADVVYAADDPIIAPYYENMVFAGESVLEGSAIGVVAERGDGCYLSAAGGACSVIPAEVERSQGIYPFARLFHLGAMIVTLPVAVIALLISPHDLTAMRVFLPVCAWLASTSAVLPCFYMKRPFQRVEDFLLRARRRGAGAILLTGRGGSLSADVTDLVIDGRSGITDGCLHVDSAYPSVDSRLRSLAEALLLLHRQGAISASESPEEHPYLRELLEKTSADPSAISLRVTACRRCREGLEVTEGEKTYCLRFYENELPLRSMIGFTAGNPFSQAERAELREYLRESVARGCHVISVLRCDDRGGAVYLGSVALRERCLNEAHHLREEAERLGIRLHFLVSSREDEAMKYLPVTEGDSVCEGAMIPNENAVLCIGYGDDEKAALVRRLREQGGVVAVITDRLSPLIDAASLVMACDSGDYRADGPIRRGRPASSALRARADLLLSDVNERGGGAQTALRCISAMRGAITRDRMLLSVLTSFQILRTVAFLMTILLGMAPIAAGGYLTTSLMMDWMAYRVLSHANLRWETKRDSLKADSLLLFFKGRSRWLIPTVAAVLWIVAVSVARIVGALEHRTEPTLLFAALLLMQSVLLFFNGEGIPWTRRGLLEFVKYVFPLIGMLVLSALIPFVGRITGLGEWSPVSFGLAAFSVVSALLSVFLLTERHR